MNLIVCKINASDEFEALKVIDNAISVIWVQRYNEAGEFEIYMRATSELLRLFAEERYIVRNDSNVVMVSEKVVLTTDSENGNFITISGRSMESVLGRRVADHLYNYSDINAETFIRSIVRASVGDTSESNRQIGVITMGSSSGLTGDISNIQVIGQTILETVTSIAKDRNYGFAMRYNSAIQKVVFGVYVGTDRSIDQDYVPPVVFSPQYDNLASSTYENDATSAKNFAYVSGEKVNNAPFIVSTPTSNIPKGIVRREMFIEAGESTQRGSLTDAQYTNVLRTRGKNSLAQLRNAVNFSGEVLYQSQAKFGVDYFMGDKVQVDNGYGINASAYVIEVTEVDDETGYSVHPTLSKFTVQS